MTQSQLAERAGVTHVYICYLERGQRQNPTVAVLQRIAAALGVPASEFLDE